MIAHAPYVSLDPPLDSLAKSLLSSNNLRYLVMPFALTVTSGKLSPTGVKKIKNNYRMSSCIQATDNCYSDFF